MKGGAHIGKQREKEKLGDPFLRPTLCVPTKFKWQRAASDEQYCTGVQDCESLGVYTRSLNADQNE